MLAEVGRADEARPRSSGWRPGTWPPCPGTRRGVTAWPPSTLAYYHLGDAGTAGKLQPLLEAVRGRNIVTGRVGAICLGPAAYFLGLLSLTLSGPDRRCTT